MLLFHTPWKHFQRVKNVNIGQKLVIIRLISWLNQLSFLDQKVMRKNIERKVLVWKNCLLLSEKHLERGKISNKKIFVKIFKGWHLQEVPFKIDWFLNMPLVFSKKLNSRKNFLKELSFCKANCYIVRKFARIKLHHCCCYGLFKSGH